MQPAANTLDADASVDSHDPLAEERHLLARAQAGDSGAFAALHGRFAAPLYRRVLLPKLGDHAAAEDALAETFKALVHKLPDLTVTDRSLWHWLSRVATNKAIDVLRKRGRQRQAMDGFEQMMQVVSDAGARHQPGEVVSRLALEQLVGRCLDALNPRYARVLRLRFFEGKARDACAAELNIKLGTFDVVVLRALKAFRKTWDEVASDGSEQTRPTQREAAS